MSQAPRRAAGPLEWTVQDLETRDSLTSGEAGEARPGGAGTIRIRTGGGGSAPAAGGAPIDVRDFIVRNVTPYSGDEAFLAGPSKRTKAVWEKLQPYFRDERKKGVLAVDAQTPSTMLAHKAGYIDRENEVIVGLQTDQPFKRAIFPFGGLRMVEGGLKAAGFEPDPLVHEAFTNYRKSAQRRRVRRLYAGDHEVPQVRHHHRPARCLRPRPHHRRLPPRRALRHGPADRGQAGRAGPGRRHVADRRHHPQREELAEQMRALEDLAAMAKLYDCDISRPATDAQEAVQWTYFAYLGAIKEANGAAMSIGRISTFLDIYIERDLKEGRWTKRARRSSGTSWCRSSASFASCARPTTTRCSAATPTGRPNASAVWISNGRTLVTKSSYRMLHTLTNLGPAPEPNITVLWSSTCRTPFKRYCVKVSQRNVLAAVRERRPDAAELGRRLRHRLLRLGDASGQADAVLRRPREPGEGLLYAINGGRDEISGEQVAPPAPPVTGDVLDYDEVMEKFDRMMEWLARTYVHAMNCIHYMHDKYFYERLEMALHDRDILRTMAFGIAGLSVVADSLSGHQVRQGPGDPRRDRARRRLSHRG